MVLTSLPSPPVTERLAETMFPAGASVKPFLGRGRTLVGDSPRATLQALLSHIEDRIDSFPQECLDAVHRQNRGQKWDVLYPLPEVLAYTQYQSSVFFSLWGVTS